MALFYAHALIENPETGDRYEVGDRVPATVPGLAELKKGGAVKTTKPKKEEAK